MSTNLKQFVTDIADAIRGKKGSEDLINPQDFASEIENLPSGGDFEVESIDNGDGTQTLEIVNTNGLPATTATASDIAKGKTAYIKGEEGFEKAIGTLNAYTDNDLFLLFNYTIGVPTNTLETEFNYSIPVTSVRTYYMYKNTNYINITLNPNTTSIASNAFYNCYNFKINGLENTKVTSIGDYAFYKISDGQTSRNGLDFTNLPSTLTDIGSSAFYGQLQEGGSVVIPSAVTSVGTFIFFRGSYAKCGILALNNIAVQTFRDYVFFNCSFKCDFASPNATTFFGAYFNYNTGFKNIVLGSKITSLGTGAFNAETNKSSSDVPLKNVIILSTAVPSFNADPFARQIVANGGSIYVLDDLVEAYKAHPRMAYYVDIIKPLSELPSNLHSDGKAVITLDANGGEVETSTVTADGCGVPITLPTPTKAGSTFKGWTGYGCLKAGDGTYYSSTIEDTTWTAEWE